MAVGYVNSDGVDLDDLLVPKSYLMDRYPELANTFRFAGLWAWGDNAFGQIGDNTTSTQSSPVQTIAGGANWKQVSYGNQHTAAIKTDGTLWLWGYNARGQLADNTTVSKSSPVQTISAGTNWKQIACGFESVAAIKTDGTLWLWGNNSNGQIGDNTRTNRSSPIQTIAGGTNWKQVSCGSGHAAAIKTDGTLWLWGYNGSGQLGNNTVADKSSPVQTIAGGTNWKQVACGNGNTAAIKTDGTLWLWGYNVSGQLGDNTTSNASSPIQTIAGGTNWKQVACNGNHTASVKTDGTLWLWGNNGSGQLGDNTITTRSSPVQTIAGGTNWKLVSCGTYHTAAIKTDGTLWSWGAGARLGTGGSPVSRSSPIQTVAGGTNWMSVSANVYGSSAIRDNSNDYI